jgi:hypothetical protein
VLAVLVLALGLAPAGARADGDPASDYLITQDTFFPYQPNLVSPNVAAAVKLTAARARAAGFPIKVAVIGSASDLGAVPDLFGKPQAYADFLDREISYNKKAMLLVVMPQGFGVAAAGPPSVLAGESVPGGSGGDRLARAAIPAVGALAAHAGHPIVLAAVAAAGRSSGGGGSPALLTFGAPLVLVLLLAGGAAIARSRRIEVGGPDDEEDDDDEDDDGEGDDDEGGPGPGGDRQVEGRPGPKGGR